MAAFSTVFGALPADGEALTENRAASAAFTALAQEDHTCL
jgi:hypothetical protein